MVIFGEARRQCRKSGYAFKDENGVEVCGPRKGLCACKEGNCFSVEYFQPEKKHPHDEWNAEAEKAHKERLLEQFDMQDEYAVDMGTD